MFSINFNKKKNYVFSHDLINNQVSRLALVRTIVHGWTIKSIQLLPVALLVSWHLIKFVRQKKTSFNIKKIFNLQILITFFLSIILLTYIKRAIKNQFLYFFSSILIYILHLFDVCCGVIDLLQAFERLTFFFIHSSKAIRTN
jgi:hypothetical protein